MNMADRTGLEPATSGVTGRHSNQLNYRSATNAKRTDVKWWVVQGSNLRPSPCKGDALPAELTTPSERAGILPNWRSLSNFFSGYVHIFHRALIYSPYLI